MASKSGTRASVLRSPLLPAISDGIAAMPPDQAFTVMLRVVTSMIAGVALRAARCPPGHPVGRCARELVKILPALGQDPESCQLEQLHQIAEEVGAQIWHLISFQSDLVLRADLEELVASVCQPAPRLLPSDGIAAA